MCILKKIGRKKQVTATQIFWDVYTLFSDGYYMSVYPMQVYFWLTFFFK